MSRAYLTVRDVADRIGTSTRTVERWIERGDLPVLAALPSHLP